MRKNTLLYLKDIAEQTSFILRERENLSHAQFKESQVYQYAMIRAIEIIGEAAKQIPLAFTGAHPEIPWSMMARMRDKLIHGYADIDAEILWHTISNDIPVLHQQILAVTKEVSDLELHEIK